MTKAEIISLIRNRLPKHDQTNKYHDNVIAASINTVRNNMFNAMPETELLDLDLYSNEYNSVSVSQDATTGVYYSDYPASITNISRFKNKGVTYINATQSFALNFVPITGRLRQLIEGGDLDVLGREIGYRTANNRIEYYNMPNDIIVAGVRIRMVIDILDMTDDQELHIPGGNDEFLVESVIKSLSGVPTVDLENDNSDQ